MPNSLSSDEEEFLKQYDGEHIGVCLPCVNANLLPDNEWTWSETDKKEWKEVTSNHQQFYEHWRKSSSGSKFANKFPYKLSLGVAPHSTSRLPFGSIRTLGNQIVVTRSYEDMFHRLLRFRKDDTGTKRGAVLTGQPGIGTSLQPDLHPVRQLTDPSILQEKLFS
jgi:hypothetical protein